MLKCTFFLRSHAEWPKCRCYCKTDDCGNQTRPCEKNYFILSESQLTGLKTLLRKCIVWFSLVVLSSGEGPPSLGFQSQGLISFCVRRLVTNMYIFAHFVRAKVLYLLNKIILLRCQWWWFELVVELEGDWMFTVVSTCSCTIRLEQIPPDKPCQMTHSKFYWQVVFYSGQ